MAEVLLDNVDLTVFGGPTTLDVSVDVGEQGTRGSKIWAGPGSPYTYTTTSELLINDLYINTSPGVDYGYLYQYVSEPGGDTWIEILKMNPTIFSKNYSVTFSSGTAEVIIPIADITSAETAFVADNFSIQYSIAHDSPVASAMTLVSISGDDLVIDLEAVEYVSSAWSNLAEEVVVHFFITIVEAGES